MPRVALVAPYFPPESGGGVFRILKLVPHLAEAGWEPTVFTIENPGMPQDATLLAEIPRNLAVTRIPANAAQRLQRGPLRRLGFAFEALGLSANAAAQWDHLAEALLEAHRTNPFDLVLSTSPPAAPHRTVLAMLDHLAAPQRPAWIADFRDPWRRAFTYQPLTDAEAALDVRDEGRTLYSADLITTTMYTSMLASCMEHSLPPQKLAWIPNGFDPADLEGLPASPISPAPPTRETPLTFGYSGALYGAYNLDLFIDGLALLFERQPAWRGCVTVECYGPRNKSALERVRKRNLLEAVQFRGYLPHRAVLRAMAGCHWALVAVPQDPRAQDMVPGKAYEYLAARFPVLGFASPDSGFAKLMKETQGGRLITSTDPSTVCEVLTQLVTTPTPLPSPGPGYAEFSTRYSRSTVAEEFAAAFDRALMLRKGRPQ